MFLARTAIHNSDEETRMHLRCKLSKWTRGNQGSYNSVKKKEVCTTVDLTERKVTLCKTQHQEYMQPRLEVDKSTVCDSSFTEMKDPGERREGDAENQSWQKKKKRILRPTSLKSPAYHRTASGNFSMAPAELEFSLIFTFSRRPPRRSAIVRAASLAAPITITEKMQRSELGDIPTYLPTDLTARSCR